MHKRIIWTLFFAAFILDVIRLQSEKSSKKVNPKKNKIEPTHKEEKPNPIHDKEEEDLEENEELKVVNNFKNKNKNINLRIEFCQS